MFIRRCMYTCIDMCVSTSMIMHALHGNDRAAARAMPIELHHLGDITTEAQSALASRCEKRRP